MKQIKKVAVIGSGVMGAGIAAQLANAGIEVELLDIVPKGAADRDAVSKGAVEKMLKAQPAPFMSRDNAALVHPGNVDDHLDRLKDCDLIIEAVIEDAAVKSALFKKIDAHRKSGSIVTSNTSTLPLHTLIDGQSEEFKKDFVITHFFNPPRYTPLVELVTSAHNSAETVDVLRRFTDETMGKHVIFSKDTAGFITTRLGTFWLQVAANEAYKNKLTVEEADAVCGAPMGVPNTGVFGLSDLVGLDLLPHVKASLRERLPQDDSFHKVYRDHPLFAQMVKDGYLGRKVNSKGGFYRVTMNGDKKVKEAVDLDTGAYRPALKDVKLECLDNARAGGLRAMIETNDKGGQYAWSVLKQVVCYAADIAASVADDITAVDEAMKLGYNWKSGPFELVDQLGVDYFIKRLEADGDVVPELLEKARGKSFYRADGGRLQQMGFDGKYANVERADGVILLSDIKRASKPVASVAGGGDLWDIGDGVLCLEFTSRGHAISEPVIQALEKAMAVIGDGKGPWKALVLHHEGEDFSFGADVGRLVEYAQKNQRDRIEPDVKYSQDVYKNLKYAPFPTVAAPMGRAIGGGCEILLHCSHVQAYAEMYMGLIEVSVGLVPAWGGSTEMMTRALQDPKLKKQGPMAALASVFETLSRAKVSASAQDAQRLMYLRATDGITMNKDRLLADAKKKALELVAAGYAPPAPADLELMGPAGRKLLNMAADQVYLKGGVMRPYDVVVLDMLARVLTGGDAAVPGRKVTPDEMRALEVESIVSLLHDDRTIARLAAARKMGFKPMPAEKTEVDQPPQELRDAFNKKAADGAKDKALPKHRRNKHPKP